MSKVVKLKHSDIVQIVTRLVEQSFDDYDTQIQPEELPNDDEIELSLGQDDEGNYYVMKNGDSENPQVIYKTK